MKTDVKAIGRAEIFDHVKTIVIPSLMWDIDAGFGPDGYHVYKTQAEQDKAIQSDLKSLRMWLKNAANA